MRVGDGLQAHLESRGSKTGQLAMADLSGDAGFSVRERILWATEYQVFYVCSNT
jgi:hypothetical protein